MTQDPLFMDIRLILHEDGIMNWYNVLTPALFFDDKRISIVGLIDQETKLFAKVLVGLKMNPDSSNVSSESPAKPIFGMTEASRSQYKTVYAWKNEYAYLCRRGRWVQYVHQLADKIREQIAENDATRWADIDDSALFPEIEDTTTQTAS